MMPDLASRVSKYGTTIFTEINNLAAQYDTVDLGQGRPDFDTPPSVVAAAVDALQSGKYSQYAPGYGAPALCHAISDHVKRFYELDVDPNGGVLVTCGATEGIFAAIMGSIDPGDEVILIEPFYDIYVPCVEMSGGIPVYVPLQPPNWELNADALKAAFSERTRAIVINSPNNPTGRVFNAEERQLIADLCIQYDVICIADEVYEHMVYGDLSHTPLAILPGMFERTLTISSVAKTFSATGWKIGWVYGDPKLVTGVFRAHQLMSFAIHHPGQIGVAHALNLGDDYYHDLKTMYTKKRDLLVQGLNAASLPHFVPEGAFYIMADFSGVYNAGNDAAFVRHLISEIGVAGIPPSAFYSPDHQHMVANYVRFAFCKTDETIEAACERLLKLTR